MKDFEQRLKRLEFLAENIKQNDISLEDALKYFEEGIKLSKGMEAEIDKIEAKIQILINEPAPELDTAPELELFSDAEMTGPKKGTRA